MKRRITDRRFALTLAGVLLGLIVLVTVFAPKQDDSDPLPTTDNSGSGGAKAAYLLLQDLGYQASRWEAPTADLRSIDAAHTTLVMAEPTISFAEMKEVRGDLAEFLAHGGRVLTTGAAAAFLFEGGGVKGPTNFLQNLCLTTPEGQGELARAGQISIPDFGGWEDQGMRTRVEQRCGDDAVVVRYQVGAGEVVWWSSAMPLTNRGLKQDASLKLLLASVGGTGRRIVFDEGYAGYGTSLWGTAKGLPLWALETQLALVGVLLVLSFGRRSGPVRSAVKVSRSSPLEFAESMGHLYQKAGATQVAIDGARLRLLRFLHERCGISQAAVHAPAEEVAEAVRAQMGGEWNGLREHLAQAAGADHAALQPRSALALVRALDADKQQISEQMRQSKRDREGSK